MNNTLILTKVKSTQHYVDVVIPANSVAGGFLALGTLGSDGTFASAAPAAVTTLGMVMLAPVPLSYGVETLEKDYVLTTGAVERAIVLEVGNIIDIPVENITATATVAADAYLVPKASAIKPECLSTLGGTEVIVLKILKVYTKTGQSYAQALVVRA